jgi:hypothetical protein
MSKQNLRIYILSVAQNVLSHVNLWSTSWVGGCAEETGDHRRAFGGYK